MEGLAATAAEVAAPVVAQHVSRERVAGGREQALAEREDVAVVNTTNGTRNSRPTTSNSVWSSV